MPDSQPQQVEQLQEELRGLLPDRCRRCGHYAVGLLHVTEDVAAGRMTLEQAHREIQEAAKDIDSKCQLGLVTSAVFRGMYACSYGIDPKRLAEDYARNEYFDYRFEL